MVRARYIDWLLVAATTPLLLIGLLTMKSLGGDDYFFNHQIVWIILGFAAMIGFTFIDWRILKSSAVILTLYFGGVGLLLLLSIVGFVTRGAQSWFNIGFASIEPVEVMKFVVILLLAKYFSQRYVEMALWRHILISFVYVAIPMGMVLAQPDFGSAGILLFIWASMVLFSGLSIRQALLLLLASILIIALAWSFMLEPYQKARIMAFLQPESDPQGSGYHAIQAMIAVGSGGLWGKGVGFGTQTRLNFLPESETDFIFAAFAEEWGLAGVIFLVILFGIIFWRIFHIVRRAPDNFSKLVGLGFAFLLIGHIVVHVGMNVGLLPITGIGLPFMSYGGSFLVLLMAQIGLLQSIAVRSSAILAIKDENPVILSP